MSPLNALHDSIGVHLPDIKVSHVVFIGLATISYALAYKLWLYPFFFSPLRTLPGPPLGHPIFGQSLTIINNEVGLPQREWIKKYGPVVRTVGPIGLERLMFLKPEALHKILVKDWVDYPRPGFLRKILGLVTGYGLLTVTGDEHKQMRKAMNPAFSIPNLMAQTDMYYDAINGLVQIITSEVDTQEKPEQGKVMPVYEWMSKVTLDIICETAFGYKSDSIHNPHNELAVAYEALVNLQSGANIAKLIMAISLPGVSSLLLSDFGYKYRNVFRLTSFTADIATVLGAMHTIKRISREMLNEKMRESLESGISAGDSELHGKKDIMSILVRARTSESDGSYKMSDKAMMDQVLTFIGAGHETTASGLAWTLWLLANDQESQQKLREELQPVLAQHDRPDYKTLRDLKWLDCVILESLRVMPPVPMTVRKAAKTDYIEGILVPKGTFFWIPIRPVNTWKGIWGEDAEEFHPARWLNLPKDYHPSFSLLSFIAGPHACIGKTMAIIEMKAVLAALIANFQFEPAYEGQKAEPAAAITMKPTDGMPLRVKRTTFVGRS
ncbi:cytochrome p450 [Moniliophthora roreri MCA 2997]|uniref:Cytochrome p450 n=1 Tax=Moniliophthora roreri (strain MCA 2997) TaxID=1381753 RepID=V2WRC7_MONRO|nr:cytochrome p450 [Moniliophthora roreri MCA 2997]